MNVENLFILLIFGVAFFSFCKGDRGSYEQSCNKTNRCDSQKSLSCIEDKCQCLKRLEMIYDESSKKCLILSGEKCSFTLVESRTDTFEEQRVTETFDCVENAFCDEYCSCLSDYYEDAQGLCRRKGISGENCTKHDECRSDLMSLCYDGLCSCNENEAVFYHNQCAAKVGISCSKYNRKCVPNAQCSYDEDDCTCTNGYEMSENGLCLAKYATYCDANLSPCMQQLTCVDDKCVCHFTKHQMYDYSKGECVSYVEGPCSENVNGTVLQFPCVPNAECKTQDGIAECVCKDGYESYDRKCYIAHGQPCDTSASCDPSSNLRCQNGRCTCPDLHIYDERRSLCIGLVGAECGLKDNFCVTGADCQSRRFNLIDWLKIVRSKNLPTIGTCRCSESYMSNSERKCVPKLLEETKSIVADENVTINDGEI